MKVPDRNILLGLAVMFGMALTGFGMLLLFDRIDARLRRDRPLLPSSFQIAAFFLGWCALLLAIGWQFTTGSLPVAWCATAILIVLWNVRTRTLTTELRTQAVLLAEMAQTVEQKLPLAAYFQAFGREHFRRWGSPANIAAARLEEGQPLSAALAAAELIELPLIASIAAAEQAGGAVLLPMLRRLQRETREQARTFSVNTAWLDYPFFLLFLIAGTSLFFLLNILPRMDNMMRALNACHWWRDYSLCVNAGMTLAFMAIGIFLFVVFAVCNSQSARENFRNLVNRLPLLRGRCWHRSLARAARTLGAMLEAGVPLHTAGALVAVPAIAGPHRGSFEKLAQRSREGVPWPAALRASGLPESFVTLAQAGAAAGDLPLALSSVAEWHESKARRIERWLAALLPCLAIICCGLLVASIYIGVLYGMTQIQTSLIPGGLGR